MVEFIYLIRMKTGIEFIAEERQRQVTVEGWTAELDDDYNAMS
jgi:hypothetical protein